MVKSAFKYLLALAFVLAGLNHFINTAFYLSIMPAIFPAHLFLVYLSGICEIALGAFLFMPRYSKLAAWGLIWLLLAVFPPTFYMAMNTEMFPQFGSAGICLRVPLQFLLIW